MPYRSSALVSLLDRLVPFHELNNLIWVFNANELKKNLDLYDNFSPGDDVVDEFAIDVYRRGYSRKDYEELLALAGNRPVGLGEVGMLPIPDTLRSQPRWTWFMSWGDPSGFWMGGPAFLAICESEEA